MSADKGACLSFKKTQLSTKVQKLEVTMCYTKMKKILQKKRKEKIQTLFFGMADTVLVKLRKQGIRNALKSC